MKNSTIRLMEVCGTHTMAIARAGLKRLLPVSIELVSGPGCPVCVTAQRDIDRAIAISRVKNVIMTTFGDMMRVPGSRASFLDLKRQGYDVRVVYSCLDALEIAGNNPDKKVMFMGVGFETTSPTVAATIIEAKKHGIGNFFVLSNFKLIFPALEVIASSKGLKIDGFICPGHVSVITGSRPYERIANRHKIPCVITGFEPLDILKGIEELLEQVRHKDHSVKIEYKRAVLKGGNKKALGFLDKVFDVRDVEWRGLGVIKKSGLKIKKAYKDFDAEKQFNVRIPESSPAAGCLCGKVLAGAKTPNDCRLFKKVCTPQDPVGPCMVSSEGTCAAFYHYGR